jgi:hypothetical protein
MHLLNPRPKASNCISSITAQVHLSMSTYDAPMQIDSRFNVIHYYPDLHRIIKWVGGKVIVRYCRFGGQ